MAEKMYVLDTNVLLHNPHSFRSFEGALVGIPAIVLEQLDQFKKEGSDRGRNSREVIRQLDALRARGSLKDGVKLDHGGTVKVLFLPAGKLEELPFKLPIEDNEILLTAMSFKRQGYDIVLISKDLNVRIKADALNLGTQDYVKEVVSEDKFYKGWTTLSVPAVQLKKDEPEGLQDIVSTLEVNEFVLVESQHNPHNNRVFRYVGGNHFRAVNEPRFKWPLKARNPQQLMALDLLLDPEVQLVTLFGPAGTGKTFLVLLAALHQVLVEDEYEKLMVARPVIPLGRDIGYLPGTMEEKLYTWMLPVYDNIAFIAHSAAMEGHMQELVKEEHDLSEQFHGNRGNRHGGGKHSRGDRRDHRGGQNGGHNGKNGKHHSYDQRKALDPLDALIQSGKVSLEAITYMRGRSIPFQFILIDEVQNLTPHEVKTIVSRVGEGSKIILAGDPYQIDSPYLDFSSNGLVVVNEKFKGQKLFGSVYLETSERSPLSKLVTELM